MKHIKDLEKELETYKKALEVANNDYNDLLFDIADDLKVRYKKEDFKKEWLEIAKGEKLC